MRISYIAIVIAGLGLAGGAVAQQNQAPQQQAVTPQQSTVALTDANLLKFSVAMDDIQQVGTKYEAKFQNAETPEQAQQIQQQAQSEMVNAVEAAGLTAEEYNAIAQQAQQDETLRKKILAMSKSSSGNG